MQMCWTVWLGLASRGCSTTACWPCPTTREFCTWGPGRRCSPWIPTTSADSWGRRYKPQAPSFSPPKLKCINNGHVGTCGNVITTWMSLQTPTHSQTPLFQCNKLTDNVKCTNAELGDGQLWNKRRPRCSFVTKINHKFNYDINFDESIVKII